MALFDSRYESRESVWATFAEHVSAGKVETFRRFGLDLVLGPRDGIYLCDAFDDRRFINCHCNGGVFNLGHRNPRVISALREALESLDIGNHHLVSTARATLAKRLAATTDGRLPGVVFGVSGGEAIDLALKVARAHTGRQTIVSALGGYHGHTGLAMAAGDEQYRAPFGPNSPGFVQVPFDDLPALEAAVNEETAAVILEPVPATLGMPIASAGYMAGVEAICRERGALFVVDEVQTGLGRAGAMWCHQLDALDPDILVTGKGLSGGIYPITATLMKAEIHRFFAKHPFIHISTFGGADVGCAVGLAVLDIVEEPGFLERVRALAERFATAFEGLPFALRQRGLMMGLSFPVPQGGLVAAKMMYDAGVFAIYANNDPTVLQFLPPLIISDDETDDLIRRVRGAFT